MNKRNPGRQKQLGPWPKCKVENCTRAIEGGAKGFCHTHYVAARRGSIDMQTGLRLREPMRVPSYGPGALCSVEGCFF